MTISDEIASLLSEKEAFDNLVHLRERLEAARKSKDNQEDFFELLFTVHGSLFRDKIYRGAEQLLIQFWEKLGKDGSNRWRIARKLADHSRFLSDWGTGLRWAMLGYIDCILHKNPTPDEYMKAVFDAPQEQLEKLKEIAEEEGIENHPEEVLRRFIERDDTFLLAVATVNREFPISKPYLNKLCKHFMSFENHDPTQSTEQGNTLEYIASYLVSLIPGCAPRRNMLHHTGMGETDVVIHNLNRTPDIYTEMLGRTFMIECKNLKKNVGVAHVGYFLYRMHLRHHQSGLLFVRKNVTEGAQALIPRAFHEDNLLCIVITGDDIKKLSESENPSFWKLILKKQAEFTFGQQKRNKKRGKGQDSSSPPPDLS